VSDERDRRTLDRADGLLVLVLQGEREAAVMLETVPDSELRSLTHVLLIHAANAYAQGAGVEQVIAALTKHDDDERNTDG
jgi:hypothetical protein